MSRCLRIGIGLSLLAVLIGCAEPVAAPEPTVVRMAVPGAMVPLAQALVDGYSKAAPLVTFHVTGTGARSGFEAVREGAVDLALVTWLRPDVDGGTKATAVARDAIAVIVHPSNVIEGLGLLQLRKVFTGRLNEWATVGWTSVSERVQPVSREGGSGTRDAFESLVMDGQSVTPMAILLPSGEAVVEYVASHPQAVGYVSHEQVTGRVKAIAIEGVVASESTARLGSYPITTEVWLVTVEAPSKEVEDFVRYCLGPEGQEIVGMRYGRVK